MKSKMSSKTMIIKSIVGLLRQVNFLVKMKNHIWSQTLEHKNYGFSSQKVSDGWYLVQVRLYINQLFTYN